MEHDQYKNLIMTDSVTINAVSHFEKKITAEIRHHGWHIYLCIYTYIQILKKGKNKP